MSGELRALVRRRIVEFASLNDERSAHEDFAERRLRPAEKEPECEQV